MNDSIKLFDPESIPFGKLSPNYMYEMYIKTDNVKTMSVISYAYAGLVGPGGVRNYILKAAPKEAKNIALDTLTHNQDEIFMSSLRRALKEKYKDGNMRKALLSTGNNFLVCTTPDGINLYGEELMKIRSDLFKQQYDDLKKNEKITQEYIYSVYLTLEYLILSGDNDLNIFKGLQVKQIEDKLNQMNIFLSKKSLPPKISPELQKIFQDPQIMVDSLQNLYLNAYYQAHQEKVKLNEMVKYINEILDKYFADKNLSKNEEREQRAQMKNNFFSSLTPKEKEEFLERIYALKTKMVVDSKENIGTRVFKFGSDDESNDESNDVTEDMIKEQISFFLNDSDLSQINMKSVFQNIEVTFGGSVVKNFKSFIREEVKKQIEEMAEKSEVEEAVENSPIVKNKTRAKKTKLSKNDFFDKILQEAREARIQDAKDYMANINEPYYNTFFQTEMNVKPKKFEPRPLTNDQMMNLIESQVNTSPTTNNSVSKPVLVITEEDVNSPYKAYFIDIDNFVYPTVIHYIKAKLLESCVISQSGNIFKGAIAHNLIMLDPLGNSRDYMNYKNFVELDTIYYKTKQDYIDYTLQKRSELALEYKFNINIFACLLVASNPKKLVYNNINENVLGIGKDNGQNYIGIKMEEIRTKLIEKGVKPCALETEDTRIKMDDIFKNPQEKEWIFGKLHEIVFLTTVIKSYEKSKKMVDNDNIDLDDINFVLDHIYQNCNKLETKIKALRGFIDKSGYPTKPPKDFVMYIKNLIKDGSFQGRAISRLWEYALFVKEGVEILIKNQTKMIVYDFNAELSELVRKNYQEVTVQQIIEAYKKILDCLRDYCLNGFGSGIKGSYHITIDDLVTANHIINFSNKIVSGQKKVSSKDLSKVLSFYTTNQNDINILEPILNEFISSQIILKEENKDNNIAISSRIVLFSNMKV